MGSSTIASFFTIGTNQLTDTLTLVIPTLVVVGVGIIAFWIGWKYLYWTIFPGGFSSGIGGRNYRED